MRQIRPAVHLPTTKRALHLPRGKKRLVSATWRCWHFIDFATSLDRDLSHEGWEKNATSQFKINHFAVRLAY